MECTINGQPFLIEEGPNGYVWEHEHPVRGIYTDGGPFATAAEAQQDAMKYIEGWERMQEEMSEEDIDAYHRELNDDCRREG